MPGTTTTARDAIESWIQVHEDKVKEMRTRGVEPLGTVLNESLLLVGRAVSLQQDEVAIERWADQLVPGWRDS